MQANLRVTCRAVPIPMEEMNRPNLPNTASKSAHKPDAMTFGGHRPPNLEPKVNKIGYFIYIKILILTIVLCSL